MNLQNTVDVEMDMLLQLGILYTCINCTYIRSWYLTPSIFKTENIHKIVNLLLNSISANNGWIVRLCK